MPPGVCPWPTPGVHSVAATSTASSRRHHHATHSAVLQPFNQYGDACSFWNLEPNPFAFPIWLGGSSPSGFFSVTVNSKSVLGIIPGDFWCGDLVLG